MSDTIEPVVIEKVRHVGKAVDGDTELTPDTPLLERQLLDSVELLQLVMELESAFGISIPLEELVEENFADVNRVVALVERARERAA
ncbi:acyl carrier protein [uncultured Parasphingopyxis sp.]|uniref:acyl carrier protein n=1 Tax=uncultured Parasphingopyxis sp. TaxID=1547918 RepID=UPI002628CF9F|nr:acyl carrier protein [uncultured Parasphingopyxis sp.]